MANLKQLNFGDFIYLCSNEGHGNVINISTFLKEKPSYIYQGNWNQVDLQKCLYQVFPPACHRLNEFYDENTELIGLRKKAPNEFDDAVHLILMNFKNKEVKYGDEIRLFSPFSKGFLAIKNMAQESKKENKEEDKKAAKSNVENLNAKLTEVDNKALLTNQTNTGNMPPVSEVVEPPKLNLGFAPKAPELNLDNNLSKNSNEQGSKLIVQEAQTNNPVQPGGGSSAAPTGGSTEDKKKDEVLTLEWSVSEDSLFTFINTGVKKEAVEGSPIIFEKREFTTKIRIGKRKNFLFQTEGTKNLVPGQQDSSSQFKIRRFLTYTEYLRHKELKSFTTLLSNFHIQCRLNDNTYYLCCNSKLGYFLINENEIDEGFFESAVFMLGDPEMLGTTTGSIPIARISDLIKMKPSPSEPLLNSNPYMIINCEENLILGYEDSKLVPFYRDSPREKRKSVSVILLEKDPTLETEYVPVKLTENSRFHICFASTNDVNQLQTLSWRDLTNDEKVDSGNKSKEVYKLEKAEYCYIEAHRKKIMDHFDNIKEKETERQNKLQQREAKKKEREAILEQAKSKEEKFTKNLAEKQANLEKLKGEEIFFTNWTAPEYENEKYIDEFEIFSHVSEEPDDEFFELPKYQEIFCPESLKEDENDDIHNNMGNDDGSNVKINTIDFKERVAQNRLIVEKCQLSDQNAILFYVTPLQPAEKNLFNYLKGLKNYLDQKLMYSTIISKEFIKNSCLFLQNTLQSYIHIPKPIIQTLMRETLGNRFKSWLLQQAYESELLSILDFIKELLSNGHYSNKIWIGSIFEELLNSPNLSKKELLDFLETWILQANEDILNNWNFEGIEKLFKDLNSKIFKIKEGKDTDLKDDEYSKVSIIIKCLNIIYKNTNVGSNAQNYASLKLKNLAIISNSLVSLTDPKILLTLGSKELKDTPANKGAKSSRDTGEIPANKEDANSNKKILLPLKLGDISCTDINKAHLLLELLNMHEHLLRNARIFNSLRGKIYTDIMPYNIARLILFLPLSKIEPKERGLYREFKCQLLDTLHTLWFLPLKRIPSQFVKVSKASDEKKSQIEEEKDTESLYHADPTDDNINEKSSLPKITDVVKDMRRLIMGVPENYVFEVHEKGKAHHIFFDISAKKELQYVSLNYFINNFDMIKRITKKQMFIGLGDEEDQRFYQDRCSEVTDLASYLLKSQKTNELKDVLSQELDEALKKRIELFVLRFVPEWLDKIKLEVAKTIYLDWGPNTDFRSHSIKVLLSETEKFFSQISGKGLNFEEKILKNSTKLGDLPNLLKVTYEDSHIIKKLKNIIPIEEKMLKSVRNFNKQIQILEYAKGNLFQEILMDSKNYSSIKKKLNQIRESLSSLINQLPVTVNMTSINELDFRLNREIYILIRGNEPIMDFHVDAGKEQALRTNQELIRELNFISPVYSLFLEFCDIHGTFKLGMREVGIKFKDSPDIIDLIYKIRIMVSLLLSVFVCRNHRNAEALKDIVEKDDNLMKLRKNFLDRDHHVILLVYHVYNQIFKALNRYVVPRGKYNLFSYLNSLISQVFYTLQRGSNLNQEEKCTYDKDLFCECFFRDDLMPTFCRSCFHLCVYFLRTSGALFNYRLMMPDSTEEDLTFIRGFIRYMPFRLYLAYQETYNYYYFSDANENHHKWLKSEYNYEDEEKIIITKNNSESCKQRVIHSEEIVNNYILFFEAVHLLIKEFPRSSPVFKDAMKDFYLSDYHVEERVYWYDPTTWLLITPVNLTLKYSIYKLITETIICSDKLAQDFPKPFKRQICYMLKGCATEILVVFRGTEPISEIYTIMALPEFKDVVTSSTHSENDYKTFFDDGMYVYLRPWVTYLKNQSFDVEKKREMFTTLLNAIEMSYREGNKMEIFGGYNYNRFSFVLCDLIGRLAIQVYKEDTPANLQIRNKIIFCLKKMKQNFIFVSKSSEGDCQYFSKMVDIVLDKVQALGSKPSKPEAEEEKVNDNPEKSDKNSQPKAVEQPDLVLEKKMMIFEAYEKSKLRNSNIARNSIDYEIDILKYEKIAKWLTTCGEEDDEQKRKADRIIMNKEITLIDHFKILSRYLSVNIDFKDRYIIKSLSFNLEVTRDFISCMKLAKLHVLQYAQQKYPKENMEVIEYLLTEDLYLNVINKTDVIDKAVRLLCKQVDTTTFMRTIEICNTLLEDYPNRDIQIKFFDAIKEVDDYNNLMINLRSSMKELSKNLFTKETEIQKFLYENYLVGDVDISLKSFSKLEFFQKDIKGYRDNKRICNSIQIFLKFMKLCCENNYNEFKEYFLEQRDKAIKSSVNMVDEVLINECLDGYSKSCNTLNFDLGIAILETIIEILEGRDALKMKQLVTSSQILKFTSEIFKHVSKMDIGLTEPSSGEDYLKYEKDLREMQQLKFTLITKVTELLITIIEYSDMDTHLYIIDKLDFESLITNTTENLFETFSYFGWLKSDKLKHLKPKSHYHYTTNVTRSSTSGSQVINYKTFRSQGTMASPVYEGNMNPYKLKSILFLLEKRILNNITEDIFKEHFLGLVNLRIIVLMLSATNKKSSEKLSIKLNEIFRDTRERDNIDNEKAKVLLMRIADQYITKIEILGEDKKLKTKFFPKYISCRFLANDDKKEVIENLDRTSYETKIADFFNNFEILQTKMEERYEEKKILKKKIKALAITVIRYLHLLIAAGLNIYILSLDNDTLAELAQSDYQKNFTYAYLVITIIQTVFAFFAIVTLFFDPKSYYKFGHKWDSYIRKNQKSNPPLTRIEKLEWLKYPETINAQNLKRILKVNGYRSPFLYLSRSNGLESSIPLQLQVKYNHIIFFLKNREFLLTLFDLIFCGLSIWRPLFLPFQILFHVLQSPIIQDVLKSFYINARPFGMTILLGAIIIFIYSTIGFFFLRATLSVDNDKAIPDTEFCPTAWICFVNFFNYGLRQGGGVGDIINKVQTYGDEKYTARWIYDIVFFFLITVIMLNLIFGIIINTFSGIRDQKFANREDQITKCFICNIEKGTIDKIGSGYEFHVKSEHNMWDYLFYLINIVRKGERGLTQQEMFVWRNFQRKNYSFLPYLKAICLTQTEEEEDLETQLEAIANGNIEIKNILQGYIKQGVVNKKTNSIFNKSNQLISDIITATKRLPGCTLNDSRTTSKQQTMKCTTCNVNICEFCSKNCHINHKVSDPVESDELCLCMFQDKHSTLNNDRLGYYCCAKTCTGIILSDKQNAIDYKKVNQLQFRCKTCNPDVDLCIFCCYNCHKGHDLEFKSNSIFSCKCMQEFSDKCLGNLTKEEYDLE